LLLFPIEAKSGTQKTALNGRPMIDDHGASYVDRLFWAVSLFDV